MSIRKATSRRLADFSGSRRSKPAIRAQNADRRALNDGQRELVRQIAADAAHRIPFCQALGLPFGESVWNDFDHTYRFTVLEPKDLPQWRELGEPAKLMLSFMALNGFARAASFSATIHPELEAKWRDGEIGILDRIRRRLRQGMEAQGLTDQAHAYVVEARSRSGKTRTRIHIHGFTEISEATDATRLKIALEEAVGAMGKIGRARAVKVEPSYVCVKGKFAPDHWPAYITKNVARYDARIPGKRLFMNRAMTQSARAFWALLREELA